MQWPWFIQCAFRFHWVFQRTYSIPIHYSSSRWPHELGRSSGPVYNEGWASLRGMSHILPCSRITLTGLRFSLPKSMSPSPRSLSRSSAIQRTTRIRSVDLLLPVQVPRYVPVFSIILFPHIVALDLKNEETKKSRNPFPEGSATIWFTLLCSRFEDVYGKLVTFFNTAL